MAYEEPRADSITHIFRQVVDDVRELFREELALAHAELRAEASAFTSGAIQMGIGAAVGGFAVLFLLLGIAQGAAIVFGIGVWVAYIGMGILLGIAAGVAVLMGRNRVQQTPAIPPKTVESLQETKEWISHRTTSNSK
jgi:MFS superfamily sulfate permease-like transporter